VARDGLTGVLLVGGASRRFGSAKALARIGGETLAARAWRVLGLACDERIAVGKAADRLDLGFPVVDDGTATRAALAGVVAGLRAASHEVTVLLPVDAAAVSPEVLRALARACDGEAAAPQTGPLPAALRKSALPVLERRLARGQLVLRDALQELAARVVEVDPWQLANVNTPADLEAARRRAQALAAVTTIAARLGVDASAARILQDWNDTIVALDPSPIVARVATSTVRPEGPPGVLERELALAQHVVGRGGPVVPPTTSPPPGPHEVDGLHLTLWELAEELPGEPPPAGIAAALRSFHAALADYPGALPSLAERHERARRLAADARALPRLDEAGRGVLARALDVLLGRVAAFPAPHRPLHGGAHTGNLLHTPAGPRWIDLDTVCTGPLEWDLAHLPDEAAALFPERDEALLEVMRLLVSAEVAVWCWRAYGRAPEVDEAARFHLERVRGFL
jgi:molybdopterin-guanine dinucleotide biosynthesis protein A